MAEIKEIHGVVVLYKTHLNESVTISSLNDSLYCLNLRLKLLVYDNSSRSQHNERKFVLGQLDIRYVHDSTNSGISKAYNLGIMFAEEQGADWLLMLDQDTQFQVDFFKTLLETIQRKVSDEVVCILPKAVSYKDNSIISPSRSYPGGITRPAKSIKPGLISIRSLTGINSGTLISASFMKSIGGFSNDFHLDMLDHWYFKEIKRSKKKVIMLNSIIHHDLSVVSFFDEVSEERYESILSSERLLYNKHFFDFYIYKIRLIFRTIKQLRARETVYAKLTLKQLYK